MTITSLSEYQINSYDQAVAIKQKVIWDRVESISVKRAIEEWLSSLTPLTKKNYRAGINRLIESDIVYPLISLQAFALINHDTIVDRIKKIDDWQETTRQARAAAYISFTRYLSRKFPEIFRKAMPNREGADKTFFKVREKVVTEAMNQAEWMRFLSHLEKINPRDCLVAKITLQGGKRIGEVLSLQTHQINWQNREITFVQSKTRGLRKETVITYSQMIMDDLRILIGERKGRVFISKNNTPLLLLQLSKSFARAGKRAAIAFRVTPRVLRASAVTYLRQQGFADSAIQKVTGHASSELINAYDKSSRADNPTKLVSLV